MNSKNDFAKISDEELVKMVIEKNQNYYRYLVKRYEKKLLRYVQYYSLVEDRALDVVQNTFIKAFKNLQGFKVELKFSSWLYRIAHNEAINAVKKYRKEISLEETNSLYEIEDGDFDNIKKLEIEENKEFLQQCLQKLPIKYKEILILYYFEEKSYEEMSNILKMPMGTVSVRISRAKDNLRKICEKEKE